MNKPTTITRFLVVLALCGLAWAPPAPAEPAASSLDQVLDAVIANERKVAQTLEQYQPLVETYLQTVKPDPVLGMVPVNDNYFFGRLELPKDSYGDSGENGRKAKKPKKTKTLNLFDDYHSQTFKPEAFARMLIVDRGSFDRETYEFDFVRAEFLGEIRTLVFDVAPRQWWRGGSSVKRPKGLRVGHFTGRIWVEDEDYNIVRFNGIYAAALTVNFHFDSWRLNMAPGLWLPAYVYTEESERAVRQLKLTHKGQTRIWGYEVDNTDADDEFTKVLIDRTLTRDPNDAPGQISPIESARAWESEAEENVLQRLERTGFLAPSGDVDKVLETVVANLEITNDLAIEPPVRCRVLLTTPLESFTIGHTIVISRGLIDVLPDEGSLAMVLAHEMGHILGNHRLDTTYAFSDRMLVGDKQAMEQFTFERIPAEEAEADTTAVKLLANSPYADDLASAGLFLKSLEEHADDLHALIRPHFGARMTKKDRLNRMPQIVAAAPELDPASLEQTAALPLGGRVKLDPWSARIELMKNNRVALLSAREKMSFQITPLMPYLARYDAAAAATVDERRTDGDGSHVADRR